MPDFQNVTLGVGTEVLVDGVNIGYTRGDIQFERNAEVKEFETGIPLNVVGRVPLRDQWRAVVPMAEITADNISYAALNIPVTTVAGSQVNVVDGDNQERTFAAFAGGAVERIVLDGPTVVNLVVKSQDEVTTYTANDDYILDATLGIVYRNPGGAISSGEVVRVSYDYTPAAKKRLKLGVNLPVVTRSFKFTHVSPVSGRTIVVEFWTAQSAASLTMAFQEQEFMTIDLDLLSLPDTANHPTEPQGYIDVIPAA